MIATRLRQISTLVIAGSLLSLMLATPAAAADCMLSAPASVEIGSNLTIEGSGFPANAAVDVSISIEGGGDDALIVQTNGSGAFTISLTPEAADQGVTTFVATTGSDCRAEAVIGVGVPAPVTEGGSEGAGGTTDAGPPRTDGLAADASGGQRPLVLWLVVGTLIGLGVGGRYATRPSRSR